MMSGALRLRIASGIVLAGLAAASMLFARQAAHAEPPDWDSLAGRYKTEIRPLMVRYCQECHSGDTTEANVDFASFAALADVRKHPQIWQKVGEMLDTGQMPPKTPTSLPAAERTRLQAWVHGYLTVEARARAGDPGASCCAGSAMPNTPTRCAI